MSDSEEENQTIEHQYAAIKKLMGGKTVINRVSFHHNNNH